MNEHLSTRDVDKLIADLQDACRQLFGERLGFKNLSHHRLSVISGLEQYDITYVSRDIGAASLQGCIELGLWVPSSATYTPSPTDIDSLQTAPLYYEPADIETVSPLELPSYTNVERTQWFLDFATHDFNRLRKIAKCTLNVESFDEGLYEVEEEAALDFIVEEDTPPEEALLGYDFELDSQIITRKDRQGIAYMLAALGILI